jgi:hypothetical protein
MTSRLLKILCIIIVSAIASHSAWSQQRDQIALVIGNANYPDSNASLPTTTKDAHLLADEFRRNGFNVDVKENAGKDDMQRAIYAFTAKIHSESVALFYFSGFGIQVERQTYLIPVNAEVWSESDVKRDGISLDTIVANMHRQGARIKIVIVDASRRNPFERRFRSVAAGLAPLDALENTLATYSAAPGTVIADSTGDNSLFVGELLKEMRKPKLTIEEVFNNTRVDVSRASNNMQIPWVASSLVDEFSFRASINAAVTPAPSTTPSTAAPIASTTSGPTASGPTPVPRMLSGAVNLPTPPPQPVARHAEVLVPETIPIIADRARVAVRDEYMTAADHKALAISSGPIGFTTGQSDDDTAKTAAVDICQQRADALPQKRRCELYAVGITVVYARGHPPMPPTPWVILDQSVTSPLVVNDIPLMSDAAKTNVERNYMPAHAPKALALSPDGEFFWAVNQQSGDEAQRRALENCGNNVGVPCLLTVIDDNFVIAIPTTMRAVGFFQAASATAIAPELRDDLALRLRNSSGWTAVAAGASGKAGLMLKGASEQAAVAGALASCATLDRSCRVIAIGPFAVEPK